MIIEKLVGDKLAEKRNENIKKIIKLGIEIKAMNESASVCVFAMFKIVKDL